MTLIAAFDPGVTTGVAGLANGKFFSAEFSEHELYQWVDERCQLFDHVQIESFIINSGTVKKTIVYDSLYLIGYLRYASWRCGFPTEFSKPADVMAAFPDVALKRAKMHYPGHGHANDAARHLARHMVKNRMISGSVFLPKGDERTS
jgi:hypothetical protein